MRQFLAQGFSGTTIELVANEARVAKRTIYTTFGDKTDLFVAVVRSLGDRVVQPALTERADGVVDLYGFGTRLIQLMLSDEAIGLHRLVIAEAPGFPELAALHYANGPQRYIDLLGELLAALPPGRLVAQAGDFHLAAEALFTLLLGERHRRRLFGIGSAPDADEISTHVSRTLALFLTSEP